MHGSDIFDNVRHSRLMDEFDKFAAKEGESLEYVYERLMTLVNIMDPGKAVSYDELYDSLVQFKPHVLASRAKKAAKNHDPLARIAHSNASSSHPHAYLSYSPQSYYVTHPPSVVDYDDEYQGMDELTYKPRMQAMVEMLTRMWDEIGIKCLMQEMECYNCNEKGHYACDCQKPKVCDAKYFREQLLLVMKDEAGSHLSNKENDFMLDNAYGEEFLDELTASVMLMARLQPADGTMTLCIIYDGKKL
ncbi:copia protein [Tanacetum coccineum]|uniref:Copia protein n=1 Tax=Tanacetum coccineum TaxID=301880 RepID=A0ABQ4WM13_9ASTR